MKLAADISVALVAARHIGNAVQIFFLACVVVAGVFGALTASRKILVLLRPGALLGA